MKKILVVSDLHVGSVHALMPPVVELGPTATRQARKVYASDMQVEFYEAWCDMIDEAGRVDACFVLGDCVDGVDRKSEGYDVWTTDRRAQVETAADLLSMVKTRRYFCVQGSPYHVDSNTTADLAICDRLKGTFGTDLVVVIGDKRFHLCHAIGHTSSPVSKATAPSKEIAHAAMNDRLFGRFDLLCRGHRHDYYYIENSHGRILGVPSWKARDSFAASRGLGMPAECIGGALIRIENGALTVERMTTTLSEGHQFVEVVV